MKKLLSLVLVLSLVLGSVAFAFATPKDVVGTDYDEAVTRLGALGILQGYPDGSFKPDNTITRAEFAAVVVRSLGLENAAAMKGTTSFTDVPADNWASGYINIADGLEIIKGYGNGMYGPSDPVTYEQAVTMIMRTLGYAPEAADKGGYPNGFIVVAAETGVTDDVSGVLGAPAPRGVVAILMNNALDVNLMERVGYGDEETYSVTDKTLLTDKLGATELDTVRVTDVPFSDSNLDSDEVALDGDTYTLLTATDANSYFGLEVTAWVNDDDEIFYWTVETDAADIIYDTVKVDVDNDDYVTLLVEDDTFDFASGADTYVNFDTADLTAGDYGRFVMEDDEVVFASVFNFDVEGAVVKAVDSNGFDYISAGDEDTLEIDNYDDAYYFTADMMEAELGDVEADNAIAYFENDDELFVMFADAKVEGALEAAKTADVKVDGSWYDLSAEPFSSTDELDTVVAFDNAIDDLNDFMDENVVMVLDFNGDALAIVANVDGIGDTIYGVVTWANYGSTSEMTVFNGLGEEATYDFETRSDVNAVIDADTIGEDRNYFETSVVAVEFELNSDGEVADEFDGTTGSAVVSEATIVELKKGTDSRYIDDLTNDGDYYYIDSDTIFIDATDGTVVDPALIDYDDVYDNSFGRLTALVFGESGRTADAIVFVSSFDGTDADNYYAIALADYYEISDDQYAELDVYAGDKDDYLLDDGDEEQLVEGQIFKFSYNSDDAVNFDETDAPLAKEILNITSAIVDGDYVTYTNVADGKTTIKVADDAVIYTADDLVGDASLAIDTKVSASKLDDYTNVRYILNGDGEMVVVLVWNGVTETPGSTTEGDVVTFVNTGHDQMVIDAVIYAAVPTTVVKNSDGDIIGLGDFEAIDKGDYVTVGSTTEFTNNSK
ncbi:MAG: S-layer homology domain-containing protein [Peptostreptococcaceae bacterium]|nr:S-layer homology domain-containing protein [Peptostreptococcaceae bacterium]